MDSSLTPACTAHERAYNRSASVQADVAREGEAGCVRIMSGGYRGLARVSFEIDIDRSALSI